MVCETSAKKIGGLWRTDLRRNNTRSSIARQSEGLPGTAAIAPPYPT